MPKFPNYCGCCGREMPAWREWCADCEPHVLTGSLPPWEKTYYARYGRECPFAPTDGDGGERKAA